jgi:L-ornithine Nalpha-acyltransferase
MMHSADTDPTAPRRLRVRLAESAADIYAVQKLRFNIFYGEMGATPTPETLAAGRDIDPFDAICDHLLVEHIREQDTSVVGTYRLLRQSIAEACEGFYSAAEFNLAPLLRTSARSGGELLELGRSCVEAAYRDSGTIQLLWQGIAAYLRRHHIGHMIGCASFPGTDASAHAAALAYLQHHHLAPADLRARVRPEHAAALALPPIGGYDPRLAMRALPPLIKGYLRVGAMVGTGAFVDRQFNTVDVFMVMPVAQIARRYGERFGAAA